MSLSPWLMETATVNQSIFKYMNKEIIKELVVTIGGKPVGFSCRMAKTERKLIIDILNRGSGEVAVYYAGLEWPECMYQVTRA